MIGKKKQVVVIGNGMVGFRFCEKLLEYDAFHQYQLTVLGEELTPAYDRVALTTLFNGKTEGELVFAEARWYEYQKINLRVGARVVRINRAEKTVEVSSGKSFPYDRLVLATGARPRVPNVAGTELNGVHVYRTSDDALAIRDAARGAENAVVVGGGLLGLEVAEACRELGVETTIVEREPFLMACQLDADAGRLLDRKIEDLGLHMKLGAQLHAVEGSGKAERARLGNGEAIPAELVVIAAGITPNDELAREAGLEIGPRGGVAINERAQTSDPDVFAIGECASFNGATFGLVAPGYAMAEVAAARLGDINKTFEMITPAAKLKLLDLQVASIGRTHLNPPDAVCLVDQAPDKGVYKKLILSKDRVRLLGAILVGETSEFERLRKLIEQNGALPADPLELLAPIGKPLAVELELEHDDVVCFCNYVTKGDIVKAIDSKKLQTTSEVMGETYAAGLCGSCMDVLDAVTKQYVATGV